MAIKSFRHKGLKRFFYDNDVSKLNPNHVVTIGDILDFLEASHHPMDMKAIFGVQFAEKKELGKGYIVSKLVVIGVLLMR